MHQCSSDKHQNYEAIRKLENQISRSRDTVKSTEALVYGREREISIHNMEIANKQRDLQRSENELSLLRYNLRNAEIAYNEARDALERLKMTTKYY